MSARIVPARAAAVALAAIAGMVAVTPAPGSAQEAREAPAAGAAATGAVDTSTPEASTEALVVSMRASDWSGMADLMHPDALEELREMFLPLLRDEDLGAFRQEIFGIEGAEEASALDGRQIYEGFISFALTADPTMTAALQTVDADVIGHVMEGDTAHVVYRLDMNVAGIDVAQTAVASYRRRDGRWLGLLTTDLRGMIAGMRQALDEGGP